MDIVTVNHQKKIRTHPQAIQRLVKVILRHEGVLHARLGIALVSASQIKAFNRKYLNKDYATDVLAFGYTGDDFRLKRTSNRPEKKIILGDVIVSVDAAAGCAKELGRSINDELALYLVHGILHLLGFDDHRPADIARMRARERTLIAYLNSKNLIRPIVRSGRH